MFKSLKHKLETNHCDHDTSFLRIGVIRADLKHCGKIPEAREELNRSVREGRI